jgi:hypothetical protein
MSALTLPFVCVLYGLTTDGGTSSLSRVMQHPFAQWLGTVSYSLYLSHALLVGYTKLVLFSEVRSFLPSLSPTSSPGANDDPAATLRRRMVFADLPQPLSLSLFVSHLCLRLSHSQSAPPPGCRDASGECIAQWTAWHATRAYPAWCAIPMTVVALPLAWLLYTYVEEPARLLLVKTLPLTLNPHLCSTPSRWSAPSIFLKPV